MSGSPSATIDVSGPSVEMGVDAKGLFSECWVRAVQAESMLAPVPPKGLELLRVEIGRCLGHDPAEVIVTSGVRSAIPLLIPFLRSVLVEVPTFEEIPRLLEHLGCDVRRTSWEELASCTDPIWVTSPSRNPDGATLTRQEREALAASGSPLVVVNETYRWGGADDLALEQGFVTVGSFSKVAGTGLRVGWLRGEFPAQMPASALRCASPAAPIQRIWADFLSQGGLELAAMTFVEADAARIAFVDRAGPYLRENRPSQGPSLLAQLPGGLEEAAVRRHLGDYGVLVNEGKHFGAQSPSLRLCFLGISTDAAHEAADRYKAALTELVGHAEPASWWSSLDP